MKIPKDWLKHSSQKIISKMVQGEAREWPPGCIAFIYQPKRPENKAEQNSRKDIK